MTIPNNLHSSGDHDIQFRLLKEKDQRALKYYCEAYGPLIYNKIFSIVKDGPAAEELTQDVFLKLSQKADTLQGPDNVRGFLYVTAKNAAIDYYRQQLAEKGKKTEFMDWLRDARLREVLETEDDMLEKLWRAAERLSKSKRAIFLKRYKEGKDTQTIAREMDISVQTVRNQLKLAEAKLKKMMPEEWFTLLMLICIYGEYFKNNSFPHG